MRLDKWFDTATLDRGRDYLRRGLVLSAEVVSGGALRGVVSNGRGSRYEQHISFYNGGVEGLCSCPVGHNCKHVAAVLLSREAAMPEKAEFSRSARDWIARVTDNQHRPAAVEDDPRPEDYPAAVKDRLLYLLTGYGPQLRIETWKGRINAAGTGLTSGMRHYGASGALQNPQPAQFIRPVDVELLWSLAQARLWEASYAYVLPGLLQPKGEALVALIRRLCATGRFLYANRPDAVLTWSETCPSPRLVWQAGANGGQRLGFTDESGAALDLRTGRETGFWIDAATGRIGRTATVLTETVLRLVETSPTIMPAEAEAIAAALPADLEGLSLPRPTVYRPRRRTAGTRFARLTLGSASARDGWHRHAGSVQLPAMTLRFVYDGQEVASGGDDPRLIVADEVVTLARDPSWERSCIARLMAAGAMRVEDMERYAPGERMLDYDFVLAEGDVPPDTQEIIERRTVLDFAFLTVPDLRDEGWEVVETRQWPFRRSDEPAALIVATRRESGEAFQGNDWFSLGFQVEIGGRREDVAPLIAAFLEQGRAIVDGDRIPDLDELTGHLADNPVYLDRGKKGFVILNLTPLARLLHLFLTHHSATGALHPSESDVAVMAEEALAGSDVQFEDRAGIVPLARSLQALSSAGPHDPPKGLATGLRPYQAYGASWMARLLKAGFGGLLADDMGLGKTVQMLALLQSRKEAGLPGPALLVVPTSLLHGWQSQAAQFTPGLRLVSLHGRNRAAVRDDALAADLVVTTYPLLGHDRDWLAAQDWPLVILDEAQTLKNPASQMAKALREIPAHGRMALTGTPMENSLQDLWTLTDWVNPGLLGDRKGFQKLFRTPIEKHGDPAAQARLNRRLRPFLLRRTKDEVAAELPAKTEILNRIDLTKPQRDLYETVRSAMDLRVREAIAAHGLAGARITVLDALLKLRQVCCDPALVKSPAASTVSESAKRERLRDLLAELVAEGRRVLVFSQFVEMLELIRSDLAGMGIACLSLTGQTRNRADVLDAFSCGEAAVFLLSLKAGGVGLTLTEADTVILYDPWWNPAVERQAMDRVHRIGQDKPVFVHRLVAAGTVEEKILAMQARKQALADALFDEEAGNTGTLLDEATLQELFSPITQ